MKTERIHLVVAITAAFLCGLAFSYVALAAQKEYKPDLVAKNLMKGALPGSPGKTVTIDEYTAPPGYVGEKHFHTGPVYLYILEGELAIETAKGTEKIAAGHVYLETPNLVMRPKNFSTSKTLKLIAFQVTDTGQPLMIKAK